MKSLSYRNVKWLSYVCEVRNNGERDGDSRRERDGGTEKWTDFQRASRNRKLPLVRSGFVVFRMAISHMQSIPFVSASQAERRCTTL